MITISKVNGGYEIKIMSGVPPVWVGSRVAALAVIEANYRLPRNSRNH